MVSKAPNSRLVATQTGYPYETPENGAKLLETLFLLDFGDEKVYNQNYVQQNFLLTLQPEFGEKVVSVHCYALYNHQPRLWLFTVLYYKASI